MDIISELRRAEQSYRSENKGRNKRPLRIVLRGAAAQAFADELLQRHDALKAGGGTYVIGEKSPDEQFMDGGVCYFKGIPVVAELEPEEILVLG